MIGDKTKRVKSDSGNAGRLDLLAGRVFASAFILLIIALVCFWSPLALASGTASGDEYNITAGADQADDGPLLPPADEDVAPSVPVSDDESAGTESGVADEQESVTPEPEAVPAKQDAPEQDAQVQNESSATTAEVEEEQYDLDLVCGEGEFGIYWASRADYDAGLLSIDYRLSNKGPGAARDIRVTGATANNGVTVWTDPLPSLGDLESGEWIYFTLKWLVPKNVGSFQTSLTICAFCDDEEIDDGDEGDDDEGDEDEGDEEDKDEDDGDLHDGDDDPGDEVDNENGGNDSEDIVPVNDGSIVTSQSNSATTGTGITATVQRSSLPATGINALPTALSLALIGILGLLTTGGLRLAKNSRKR